jgi:hypothetical protein
MHGPDRGRGALVALPLEPEIGERVATHFHPHATHSATLAKPCRAVRSSSACRSNVDEKAHFCRRVAELLQYADLGRAASRLVANEGLDVAIELHECVDQVTDRIRDGRAQLGCGIAEHVVLDSEDREAPLLIGPGRANP